MTRLRVPGKSRCVFVSASPRRGGPAGARGCPQNVRVCPENVPECLRMSTDEDTRGGRGIAEAALQRWPDDEGGARHVRPCRLRRGAAGAPGTSKPRKANPKANESQQKPRWGRPKSQGKPRSRGPKSQKKPTKANESQGFSRIPSSHWPSEGTALIRRRCAASSVSRC
jgi:hypothetical protein